MIHDRHQPIEIRCTWAIYGSPRTTVLSNKQARVKLWVLFLWEQDAPLFVKILIPFTQGCLVLRYIKTDPVVLEKIQKNLDVFSLFCWSNNDNYWCICLKKKEGDSPCNERFMSKSKLRKQNNIELEMWIFKSISHLKNKWKITNWKKLTKSYLSIHSLIDSANILFIIRSVISMVIYWCVSNNHKIYTISLFHIH